MSERGFVSEVLSAEQLESLAGRVAAHLAAGREEAAWAEVRPLLRAQRHQPDALLVLLQIVDERILPQSRALEILVAIHEAHGKDEAVLATVGDLLERVRDINMLNAPPPTHPLFLAVVDALTARWEQVQVQPALLKGLATAARMMARQRDEIAERASRKLIELEPQDGDHHYNLGLLLKTRGRFREGMEANQTAKELQRQPDEATQWNLGICATGAGEGEVALAVWKGFGQILEMGRSGLPEGGYPMCKVRLARRPLAERTAAMDEPGLEETIWLERQSPCHGIVRSVLQQDLAVNYGDVVLFDGAPITHHKHGDEQVPVFPHLATLHRSHYALFSFAGTQQEAGQVADASNDLERDVVIYPHSENVVQMCGQCWRDPDTDHAHQKPIDKRVVAGQIAAPPDVEPRELLRQLDAAIARREGCHLYVPGLCEAAGEPERAAVELRRLRMITNAQD
jgi:tetratricopeptide (TPR) repeat protein